MGRGRKVAFGKPARTYPAYGQMGPPGAFVDGNSAGMGRIRAFAEGFGQTRGRIGEEIDADDARRTAVGQESESGRFQGDGRGPSVITVRKCCQRIVERIPEIADSTAVQFSEKQQGEMIRIGRRRIDAGS